MTQSFNSPFTGELHPITDAPDEVFSEKMTGDGFLVYPTDSAVYAPCDSTVDIVFDTKHALGLRTADGLEYMLHIGIDTVQMNGAGFQVFVEPGGRPFRRLPVRLYGSGRRTRSTARQKRRHPGPGRGSPLLMSR